MYIEGSECLEFCARLGPAIRVTVEDGSIWLVHKGDGFGISSQTIVEDANNMSSKWRASISATKDSIY